MRDANIRRNNAMFRLRSIYNEQPEALDKIDQAFYGFEVDIEDMDIANTILARAGLPSLDASSPDPLAELNAIKKAMEADVPKNTPESLNVPPRPKNPIRRVRFSDPLEASPSNTEGVENSTCVIFSSKLCDLTQLISYRSVSADRPCAKSSSHSLASATDCVSPQAQVHDRNDPPQSIPAEAIVNPHASIDATVDTAGGDVVFTVIQDSISQSTKVRRGHPRGQEKPTGGSSTQNENIVSQIFFFLVI